MRSCTRYLPVAKDGSGRVRSGCAWHCPARPDLSSPLARRASGLRILRVRSSQRARWQWHAAWLAADESQVEEAASRRFWLGISPHLARLFITPSLRFNCRQFSLPSHQQRQLVFPVRALPIQKLCRQASLLLLLLLRIRSPSSLSSFLNFWSFAWWFKRSYSLVYGGWRRLGSCKKTGRLCSSEIWTRPSCLHWFQGDDSGSERDSESVILRDVFFFFGV
jgi:hypothetical protein